MRCAAGGQTPRTQTSTGWFAHGSLGVIEGPDQTLAQAVAALGGLSVPFALVGGLAVSVRGEVRFTRDVDLAIDAPDDPSVEELVGRLRALGYEVAALVEHETRGRLATVRLVSRGGVIVDLLAASCGLEPEIVARATPVDFGFERPVPVASVEDLLAMKVLSMTDRRLQDQIDARSLIRMNPQLDLGAVRVALRSIKSRGFDRGEDLAGKFQALLDGMA